MNNYNITIKNERCLNLFNKIVRKKDFINLNGKYGIIGDWGNFYAQDERYRGKFIVFFSDESHCFLDINISNIKKLIHYTKIPNSIYKKLDRIFISNYFG